MMKEVLASKAQAEEKSVESAIHNATEQEPKVPASNQNVVSVSPLFTLDMFKRSDISNR